MAELVDMAIANLPSLLESLTLGLGAHVVTPPTPPCEGEVRGVMKSSSCTSLVFIRIPLRVVPPLRTAIFPDRLIFNRPGPITKSQSRRTVPTPSVLNS